MVQIIQDDRAGIVELHRQRRVQDIGRGQPLVHPAGSGADGSRDVFQERDNVVIGPPLDLRDLGDGELRPLPDGPGVLHGNLAQCRKLLAREDFYLQPDFKFALLRPEPAHFGEGISVNHRPERIRELSVL